MVRKRNGSRHPAINFGVLAYADDICLLAESIDDFECSFHRLERFVAEIGLAINHNKTKAMHLKQVFVRHVRFANGDPVNSCDNWNTSKYPHPTPKRFFDLVYPRHWQPRLSSNKVFSSKSNDAINKGLCRSPVESILLYGLKCLPFTSTIQEQLDAAYRRILCYALGFTSLTAYPTQS